jgi:tagatose-1,6-bisphosphate aldolase non-catalytic subunit AgaZ/GatZ
MKLVVRGAIFNILCIIVFGFIYWYYKNHFTKSQNTAHFTYGDPVDYFYLSTNIQSSVGYAGLTPITDFSKIVIMIQQVLMITSNIFLLYILTL